MLSTFPPTECGIATFSAALTAGIIATGATVDVVRCGVPPPLEHVSVLGTLKGDPCRRALAAVDVLNAAEVAIIQHEYGIYDGPDGSAILGILDGVTTPTIVVAHTVVASPTVGQRRVLEQVCAAADAVVVMTETGRSRLVTGYDIPSFKVTVIPHGAAVPMGELPLPEASPIPARPRLLTWGLLGPGKGHRVGDRCRGGPRRPETSAGVRGRRRHPSEGSGACGRGLPQHVDQAWRRSPPLGIV